MSHPSDNDPTWQPATVAVRAGHWRSSAREHAEALFLTSSFVFDSATAAAQAFAADGPGVDTYTRFGNPTVRMLEERLAAMDGAALAQATASGMAAITSLCLALLSSGDRLLYAQGLFGATTGLFENHIKRLGIDVRAVPPTDLDAWEQALQEGAKLCFVESPTNPLLHVVDLNALAELTHAHGALLVVDNTLCTPVLCRPLALGADCVVYSATKYIDGQGRVLGGVLTFAERALGEMVYRFIRTAGPSLSPFNAWVLLKGLETLAPRMAAHGHNALDLARWLTEQRGVARVHFPGLADHPQHDLMRRQQDGPGGIVSFEVHGGQQAAFALIDALRLFSITGNLGDAKSTVTHPSTTTHGRLSAAQREQAGIGPSLIRLSVGLEDVRDLKADLQRGLEQVRLDSQGTP
jgi:O-succinylhomoserine sulfhydrylase